MVYQIYNRLEEAFIAMLLAGMTLITFTNVVIRYFLNNKGLWESGLGQTLIGWFPVLDSIIYKVNMVWALELTSYMFAWMILFGMSYGVRIGAHIGIDAFTRLLPKGWQRGFAILAIFFCLTYCVVLFIGSYEYVQKMYMTHIEVEDLPIEKWMVYLILPLGLTLLFVRFLQVLWKLILGLEVSMLADEAKEAIEEHNK
ncbi:MAG: TRAP transporter small permease [Thiotrichaceae bacterium]|nr:TRAP transporter small permease [Thiotrichaceae bacterium]